MRSAEAERRAEGTRNAALSAGWAQQLIRPHRGASLRLSLRKLYILPSGFGWLWLTACAVLVLMGSGAGSTGPLLLAYGGLGLFLLSPFLTQFNLQGLELRCGTPATGFAGEATTYPLHSHSKAPRLQLRAGFRGQRQIWSGDLPAGRGCLAVPWTPAVRGLQQPGPLQLESLAPLGLFVCWTLWEPAAAQLIYPARRQGSVGRQAPAAQQRLHGGGQQERTDGGEHWHDLAPHRPEDGMHRIAWKQLARSGTRLSKRFSDPAPEPELLSPDPSLPWEQALEHLCARCLQLATRGATFGLVLEARRIEPGGGDGQLRRCLEALALAPRR